MNEGKAFLTGLDLKARTFATSAKATVEANDELCSWLLDPLARWAGAAYGERAFEDAAKGYAQYCMGVWKSQQMYEKNGRYTPESMPDLVSEVYEHEGYMVPYMWAAILIYPFWPSMTNHIALYRDEFIKALKPGAKVLELASGHGVMGLLAAETRPDITVDGFDISPPAVAVSNRLRAVSGHEQRVNFEVRNALAFTADESGDKYQGIIAAMLAEHLQDPRPLFEAIAHHLADGGIAFFSTALESAQRDHTFEFHRESEPLKMAEDVGLRVTRLVCDAGNPIPGGHFLPRALGMILRKR
ncbi:MAG TPA: class I SAM-dependent methyltransferase [Acidobacteriaceae bacterium]|jgi:2-polyprenyl-3-methyl-5-hydroxy-6-metoxy-1,4-benzoquinol methylase|nr:class I SAM-dependent methyltransferase [Acidobacteriaceae bacterium]